MKEEPLHKTTNSLAFHGTLCATDYLESKAVLNFMHTLHSLFIDWEIHTTTDQFSDAGQQREISWERVAIPLLQDPG